MKHEHLLTRALRLELQQTDPARDAESLDRALAGWKDHMAQGTAGAIDEARPAPVRIHRKPMLGRSALGRSLAVRPAWQRWMAGGMAAAVALAGIMVGARSLPIGTAKTGTYQRTYETQRAEYATITLPSGVRVSIAPHTQLDYTTLPSGAQQVSLVGQAYFQVRHDAKHPFIVRTDDVRTTVLGTAFDVQHYPGDTAVRITVTEGRVSASQRQQETILSLGDVAYVGDSATTVRRGTNVQGTAAWTRGRLVFRKTPVPEVLATLTRWSGYEFRIDSALSAHRVTMAVDIENPLISISALRELLEATMTVVGDTVVFQPRASKTKRDGVPARKSHNLFDHSMEVGK